MKGNLDHRLAQVKDSLDHRLVQVKENLDRRLIQVKGNLVRRLVQVKESMDRRPLEVMGKLVQNPTYIAAAFAKKIATPFYARYTEGMYYGNHIDDPIMGPPNQRYRTDISITIFLNEPEAYDGGELVVSTAFGEQKVKLNAGDAVLYPSSSTHQVAEVTRGERLVVVTWLQSTIRDPAKREILYNLSQARETLIEKSPASKELEQLSNGYVNLLRMWSDI